MRTPPYRIETDRLVVRCWDPPDAPLLKDAIDSSLEHLREWMPWAEREPQPLDEKVALLRRFRARFDADEDYVYGIFSADERRVVGGTGLHTRVGEDALEIGYWIRLDAIGEGYATEASAALTHVAFAVSGVDRVEIHVDPANERSANVPRKLGYVEEATLRRRHPPRGAAGERTDLLMFSILADEAAGLPAPKAAFDAAGRRLL